MHHRSHEEKLQTSYPHLLESAFQERVPGNPGKSQKDGQEDHGTVKQLGGFSPTPSSFTSPWAPRNSRLEGTFKEMGVKAFGKLVKGSSGPSKALSTP